MEDLSFLDAMASTGCVVSLAHKAAMQSSFPLLKKNYKFSKVLFFGKVMGKVGDYLIAVGIEESYLSGKKYFFWCAPRHTTPPLGRRSPAARLRRWAC